MKDLVPAVTVPSGGWAHIGIQTWSRSVSLLLHVLFINQAARTETSVNKTHSESRRCKQTLSTGLPFRPASSLSSLDLHHLLASVENSSAGKTLPAHLQS